MRRLRCIRKRTRRVAILVLILKLSTGTSVTKAAELRRMIELCPLNLNFNVDNVRVVY